ncbi:MAG: HEAT repeat domain-containing protein [Bryobacteraceae bacterium]
MTTPEAEALFAQTLLGDYEGEDAWAAVSALRLDGSRQIFERAAEWCLSDNPLKRARATAILCQLQRAPVTHALANKPEWMFRDESYPLLTKMLEDEQDPTVLDSVICALGHLDDTRAIPLIVRYEDHPDKDVRFAVSFALGSFPNDAQSIYSLLKLTLDPDADVRDWAVFGLGVQGMPTRLKFAKPSYDLWRIRTKTFARKLQLA